MLNHLEKHRKRYKSIINFLVLFVPLIVGLFLFDWQKSGLLLVASTIFIVIININDFEVFKIGKDKIELKTKIDYADNLVKQLENLTNDFLEMSMKNYFKLGAPTFMGRLEETKKFHQIAEKYSINDNNIDKMLKKSRDKLIDLLLNYMQSLTIDDEGKNHIEERLRKYLDKKGENYSNPKYREIKKDQITYETELGIVNEFVKYFKENSLPNDNEVTRELFEFYKSSAEFLNSIEAK